jgi:hypothetical protein
MHTNEPMLFDTPAFLVNMIATIMIMKADLVQRKLNYFLSRVLRKNFIDVS